MVNALEMIVNISIDIAKKKGIKAPLRMAWMDDPSYGDPKITGFVELQFFLFSCALTLHATNKKLKSLDDFMNDPNSTLDKILGMSMEHT